jgi:preprotein translocase SecE subunit
MAVTIHKPGQGYWVRVLTATMLAVVTFAAAGWLWGQMGVVASKLPRTQWSMQVGDQQGTLASGERITLLAREARSGDAPRELGTAEVASLDASAGLLVIRDVQMAPLPAGTPEGTPTPEPSAAASVRSAGGFAASIRDRAVSRAAVQPIVLQGATTLTVILIGFLIAYWLTALHKNFVEFLISTDMEMKKVNWSTRRDIIKSTWVVIAASVLIAGSLFAVDYGLQAFFRAIGVLMY